MITKVKRWINKQKMKNMMIDIIDILEDVVEFLGLDMKEFIHDAKEPYYPVRIKVKNQVSYMIQDQEVKDLYAIVTLSMDEEYQLICIETEYQGKCPVEFMRELRFNTIYQKCFRYSYYRRYRFVSFEDNILEYMTWNLNLHYLKSMVNDKLNGKDDSYDQSI